LVSIKNANNATFDKNFPMLKKLAEEVGYKAELIESVDNVNNRQKYVIAQKVIKKYGEDLTDKTFAVWGLSFKPETDDMREAPAIYIIKELVKRGLRIISGRTESHVFLVDLRPKHITGKAAEAALGKALITINKNAIPNDPEKPFVTSGIRVGAAAITTRGFSEADARELANLVADVLDNTNDEANLSRVAAAAQALCAKNPVYGA